VTLDARVMRQIEFLDRESQASSSCISRTATPEGEAAQMLGRYPGWHLSRMARTAVLAGLFDTW
jgi:hypothetical protein